MIWLVHVVNARVPLISNIFFIFYVFRASRLGFWQQFCLQMWQCDRWKRFYIAQRSDLWHSLPYTRLHWDFQHALASKQNDKLWSNIIISAFPIVPPIIFPRVASISHSYGDARVWPYLDWTANTCFHRGLHLAIVSQLEKLCCLCAWHINRTCERKNK